MIVQDEAAEIILQQFDVAHDELLPVDKDHGHLLLSQQLRLQQRLLEGLRDRQVRNHYSNICLTSHEHICNFLREIQGCEGAGKESKEEKWKGEKKSKKQREEVKEWDERINRWMK